MARRRPNYGFERKQRADKKAAKKQAKLEKRQAKKQDTDELVDTDASPLPEMAPTEPSGD